MRACCCRSELWPLPAVGELELVCTIFDQARGGLSTVAMVQPNRRGWSDDANERDGVVSTHAILTTT